MKLGPTGICDYRFNVFTSSIKVCRMPRQSGERFRKPTFDSGKLSGHEESTKALYGECSLLKNTDAQNEQSGWRP